MFAKILKQLRKKNNLTQKALAKALSLSQSTIAFYETNKKQPTMDNLKRLADFFNIDVVVFFKKLNSIEQDYNIDSNNQHEKQVLSVFEKDTNSELSFLLKTYNLKH